MKAAPWWTRGCVVMIWARAGMSVQAIADEGPAEVPDEPEIEQPDTDLDDGPGGEVTDPPTKASDLAVQYGVTREQVDTMRTTDAMGWGEIEIALALADNLAKSDLEDAGYFEAPAR